MGFQIERGCGLGQRTISRSYYLHDAGDEAWEFSGITPREVLDQLLALAPAYRGEEQDGLFIVRPRRAWDDPGDVLNRPVQPFSVENASAVDVLRVILQSSQPPLFPAVPAAAVPHYWRPERLPPASARAPAPIERPITLSFAGGTLLRALNALAVHQHANWQVSYIQTPGKVRAHVFLSDLDLWPSGGRFSILTGQLTAQR